MARLRHDPAPIVDLRAFLAAKYRAAAEQYRHAATWKEPYSRRADVLEAGAEITVYAFEVPREHRQTFGPNDRLIVGGDGSLRRETRHDRSKHA